MDGEAAAEFAEMGLAVSIPTEDTDIEAMEIMASNRDSMKAFLAVATQWRVAAGLAGLIWIGLDYNAVDVVLRRMSFSDPVFSDLQVMEASALAILNGGGV
ncbi:DUF1799 domain-containing protein [Martelella mediterranea]|uniref:Uncharacterized protein DUF1799 n=1 Tax=Martelella mediterranea TaxID=293089 RepID=A0A4R3NUW6_9HYPH|nr:DUF1799 domain-containing protein [Martelella mediterranea]TCT37425.1 uncharacterized protein DUF1799 [Martelella mediterranea]